ncbi:MAG TPA: NUDIX domain-containing protein [Pyrinomonadaceae bacterium]|nr:NUDIX domain-containing protein [Pyrinomonadaceae bacterium]
MLKKALSRIWKLLSPRMRARLVRSTQTSFTVSVAAVITNEEGKVLLLDHVLRPASGWGYPGGFLGKGEQAQDAIRREILEETGIELRDLKLSNIHTSGNGTHLEILFTARPVGEPEVRSHEITELGWFGADELPNEMPLRQQERIRNALSET